MFFIVFYYNFQIFKKLFFMRKKLPYMNINYNVVMWSDSFMVLTWKFSIYNFQLRLNYFKYVFKMKILGTKMLEATLIQRNFPSPSLSYFPHPLPNSTDLQTTSDETPPTAKEKLLSIAIFQPWHLHQCHQQSLPGKKKTLV